MALGPGWIYIAAAMTHNNKKLNKSLYKLLRPVTRLCLHFGFGYREFCELAKAAFVAVAAEDYGVHGRPTNVSRIAAMTGLTRKQISSLRKRIEEGDAAQTQRGTPICEVLKAWRTQAEFLDARGRIRALPLEGKRGSFRSLVKQYAGDIPDGAIRKELERIGAAERRDDTMRLIRKDKAQEDAETAKACAVLERAEAQLESLARTVNP